MGVARAACVRALLFVAFLAGCTNGSSVPTSAGPAPSQDPNLTVALPTPPPTTTVALARGTVTVLTLPSSMGFAVTLTLASNAAWPVGVTATATETTAGAPAPQSGGRRTLDGSAPSIVDSWQLAFTGPGATGMLAAPPTFSIPDLANPGSFGVELFDATGSPAPTTFAYDASSGAFVANGSTFPIALRDTYFLELVALGATATGGSLAFQYTGAAQTFVPQGVSRFTVQAWGAAGKPVYGEVAKGAYAAASLGIAPGTTWFVNVGGQGCCPNFLRGAAGFNGGGFPGGGGASDIRLGDQSLAARFIVAGGGGGTGQAGRGSPYTAGAGGGFQGDNGGTADSVGPGKGGTQTGGGAGGYGPCPGQPGTLGQGGEGTYGGGGGGNYGGGGGGGCGGLSVSGTAGAGGGGGSSLIDSSKALSYCFQKPFVCPNFKTGVRDGNGVIIISW